ncbi:MAG: sodium/proton-translocating pyrophosphatase [Pirellulaceae bacterium]
MEEVRIGFERWSIQAAQTLDADGLYKLSPGLVIFKQGSQIDTFLVTPESRRDERIAPQWNDVKFSTGPHRMPEGLIEIHHEQDRIQAAFISSGARLTPLRAATIIDFTNYYEANVMNPRVLIGLFLGAMTTFVFCAMTMKAVGRAASGMVEEVRRQLRESPGILTGEVKPDYERPVLISTRAAQWEMVLPALLGLLTPIATGLVLGVGGVLGLLAGSLSSGFCVALFMSNAGGSWDNAKKYIESGKLGGKGSPAHKAAVVGDTVGDPFKDTSGPSLNILIKLMSIVSVVVASLVVRYSLVAQGWL